VPPARLELLRCLRRIERAHVEHGKASARYDQHCESARQLDEAKGALAALESSVTAAHAAYHEYGSDVGERPDERLAERAELQRRVSDAEWKVSLSAPAADRLELDTAAAILTELDGRLDGLRKAVLTECSLSVCVEIDGLAAQLKERFAILCALGQLTGKLPKSVKCALPPMPFGSADISVSATDIPSLVAGWQSALEALVQDPHVDITLPGMAPTSEPDGAQAGCWGRIRKAWREARN
jgi:hypothetical protein